MKIEDDEYILVSACLAGINCKYNGGNNLCSDIWSGNRESDAC